MDKRIISFLFGWLSLTVGVSVRLLAQAPNVIFEHLSVREGLPSSAVYSITKDRQGFMWFGTRRCPTRYDGSSFRSFLFPETYLITGMAADSANRMWVASDRRGLCRIDPDDLRLKPVPNTSQVTGNFYLDSRGEGWFSDNDGIGRINLQTGVVRHYPLRQTNFFGLKANGFLEDKQHTLWAIGSDNGLFRFDRKANRFVCVLGLEATDPERRFPFYLSRGCAGSDGLLWIGAYEKGLLRYNPQTDEFAFIPPLEATSGITCVQEGCDETGQRLLWVGDQQGLLVFRPGKGHSGKGRPEKGSPEQGRFFRLTGLRPAPFFTHCIYRDAASGIVWVGTSDGMLKYNPQDNRIRTVSLPQSLVRQPVVVKAIMADRRDTTGQTFWLGLSHSGLLRWHRPTNQFTLIRYPDPESETMWINQPGDGRLWVGLRPWDKKEAGVLVYDPDQNRFVPNPAARQAGRLFSMPYVDHGLIDARHRLWIGNTDEGVRVLDSRTGKLLRYWPDSLTKALHQNNNFLTDLRADQRGRVWLATYRGLYYIDAASHQFRRADDRSPKINQPEDPAANSLLIARNGHVWAARWGSVTESRADGKLNTILTARHGLFDRENRQLAEDQTGTIWIGNAEGLHAYTPRTHRIWRLTVSDGLSDNNTTHALYMHRGNELFIGQQNGLNYLDVRQLMQPRPVPAVVISSFRVHDQERAINPARPIRLGRSDNAFSVDFSTLMYPRLPNIQYAYWLDGFDADWHYSGSTHRAYYTNLGPGTYTLHLKAADSFGQWSRRPLTLPITILPAYYETWWFRLLTFLAAAGALYGLYRYRINQLMRVQQIRNRISADLHDDIGSSLSSISILGSMARQTLPTEHPSGSMVERMVTEARQISSALDDIVWSINPRNDALSSLLARMRRYAAELFEASGIQCELIIPDDLRQQTLPMAQRQDFYLIFKEAVNNLVKHAGATQATVSIRLKARHVHVLISDNGVGFDTTVHTERSGLRNMQARALNLHGQLTIRTAPSEGTTLELVFPIRND